MAEQTVTLQPGESRVISFEATPHEAKTYQVSVDGLAGSFTALPAPTVEVIGISISTRNLVEGDPFTISITFSNPHEYDVWVRPEFSFGLLTGEPLEFIEETDRRREFILHGFEPEKVLYGWDYFYGTGFEGRVEWVNLGPLQHPGSNMTRWLYPGYGYSYAYLPVPARGQATTSLPWRLDGGRTIWGFYWVPYIVEILPPIDLDVCVTSEDNKMVVWDEVGERNKVIGRYQPIVGAVPNLVNMRSAYEE